MNTLISTRYTATMVDGALLLLRIGIAVLMIPHGLQKLNGFDKMQNEFVSFMGLGPKLSLVLAMSAELGCSILLLVGLFTRFATIPLIITMLTALFMAHQGALFGDGEKNGLFITMFLVLLILGPGEYSLDARLGKRRF
ncbi:DoxX family protein [Spirosoma rhododendri]|uniref:DoxX family protein n=1 Tax=Spirosoma rhododendri TaxID=2728024 RepID=A0A7L5DQ98_9BACT|nr:DoxX family protein [Spirosoma rhododendri]QJD80599.1 DoxX family protein [Spirosoma rhododendri]